MDMGAAEEKTSLRHPEPSPGADVLPAAGMAWAAQGRDRARSWARSVLGGSLALLCGLVHQQGLGFTLDDGFVHHHLADAVQGRNGVHGVQQHRLQNGPQAPGPGLALHGALGDRSQPILAEVDLHALHFKQLAILLGQGVLRLRQDGDQGVDVQLFQGGDDRQATDKLGDQAVANQVLGLDLRQHLADIAGILPALDLGAEADAPLLRALPDDLVQTSEGAATDEQDVGGIDLEELLLGVLAPSLGRHRGHSALDQLQQGLLHSLTGDIPSDGGIVGLARDLVDLVDVDNAHLGLFHIVVALLQQFLNDVLDILADIARLGEGGGIGDGKGHVQQPGQGFGQQGLATAGGPDHQDVALAQLHLVLAGSTAVAQALVMVVDRHRQDLLCPLLADDVLVEDFLDFLGAGQALRSASLAGLLDFLADDVIAQVDALVADEDGRACDQLADFVLALATEGAVQQLAVVFAATLGVVTHGRNTPY